MLSDNIMLYQLWIVARVSTKIIFFTFDDIEILNLITKSSKFRNFDLPKFLFRCQHRNCDFDIDFDLGNSIHAYDFDIRIPISVKEFRYFNAEITKGT
jgi:hypothetical protein